MAIMICIRTLKWLILSCYRRNPSRSGRNLSEAGERGFGAGRTCSVAGGNYSVAGKTRSVVGRNDHAAGENGSAALQRHFLLPNLFIIREILSSTQCRMTVIDPS